MSDDRNPRRAVTTEQRKAVINRILAAWLSAGDQRLGQLLVNACGPIDLFYVEDDSLVAHVVRFAKEHGG